MENKKMSGLEFLADKIDQDIEKEIEAVEKRDVEIPAEYYEQMRPFIHNLNRELEQKRKKQTRQRWLRTAAVFAIAFISLNAAALGSSEAYRDKVFSLFFDEEQGGVTFVFDVEGEMIEEWEDYWVPTWMPEGFQLYAAEKNEIGYFLMFQDNKNQVVRVIEHISASQVSFDTETLELEQVLIGSKDGYFFEDEEYGQGCLFWNSYETLISVEFQGYELNKEDIIKIAEGMKFVE